MRKVYVTATAITLYLMYKFKMNGVALIPMLLLLLVNARHVAKDFTKAVVEAWDVEE